ncbi:hypothetical protein U1E44_10525 [Arenibacter sp. GZD96]|uniref:hypothetical protein n=1 Tax=Aurantibrevibacter litoralis TaxID=3106030 RepID=UPI002AFE598A|nr:hypothetical protein [Arenibacter sp. GZD-96]MEA1786526.1 hypothetical protein [Arenibacter sp. GZD-96]
MKTNFFKSVFGIALGSSLLFISCSTDSEDDINPNNSALAKVNLKAKGTYNSATGKGIALKTNNANLEISDFLVNIKEVELEFDDDDRNGKNFYDSDDEIELKGPFELDLLAGEITFAFVDLPQARYEELEFDFDKSRNASSELFGKTILIRGAIEGVPFEFWHDFEEDVEIDFEDDNNDIIITENNNDITINFNITGILNGVDFSTARDGNNDGIIEINPRDNDGNRLLANQIKNRIKDYIDLLDD